MAPRFRQSTSLSHFVSLCPLFTGKDVIISAVFAEDHLEGVTVRDNTMSLSCEHDMVLFHGVVHSFSFLYAAFALFHVLFADRPSLTLRLADLLSLVGSGEDPHRLNPQKARFRHLEARPDSRDILASTPVAGVVDQTGCGCPSGGDPAARSGHRNGSVISSLPLATLSPSYF